jgi:hypothetical protein
MGYSRFFLILSFPLAVMAENFNLDYADLAFIAMDRYLSSRFEPRAEAPSFIKPMDPQRLARLMHRMGSSYLEENSSGKFRLTAMASALRENKIRNFLIELRDQGRIVLEDFEVPPNVSVINLLGMMSTAGNAESELIPLQHYRNSQYNLSLILASKSGLAELFLAELWDVKPKRASLLRRKFVQQQRYEERQLRWKVRESEAAALRDRLETEFSTLEGHLSGIQLKVEEANKNSLKFYRHCSRAIATVGTLTSLALLKYLFSH